MNEQEPRPTLTPNQVEANRLWKAFLGSTPDSPEPFRRFLESRDARYSYSVLCDLIAFVHEDGFQEGYEAGLEEGDTDAWGEPIRNEGYE